MSTPMTRVTLLLKAEDRAEIQVLADAETEGKLNLQIRKLIREALAMRDFPQRAMLGVTQDAPSMHIEGGRSHVDPYATGGSSSYGQLR